MRINDESCVTLSLVAVFGSSGWIDELLTEYLDTFRGNIFIGPCPRRDPVDTTCVIYITRKRRQERRFGFVFIS